MSLIDLLFKKRNAEIGSITVDAAVSERHKSGSKVTRHPIEAGAAITDHVQPMPDELTLEGVVSDTPTDFLAFLGGGDRSSTAYKGLLDIIAKRTPIKIVTTLRTYENMVLEGLEVPRDAKKGNIVHFTVSATQIRIVESQLVKAAPVPAELRGNPTAAAGKAAATAGEAGGASFLHNALTGLGALH